MKKLFWKLLAVTAALLLACCAAVVLDDAQMESAAADGVLAPLNIQLTSSTVNRGDFLEIQVLNLSDYAQYALFGQYRITAYASTEYWNDGVSYQCNPWGYIRIPTQNLNPSELLAAEDQGQFTVTVQAYDGNGNSVTEESRFTVIEPDAGELYFRVSDTVAVTGADYFITAYAPGAYRIEVYDTYDDVKFTSDGYNLDPADGRGRWSDGYNFRGDFSYWAKAYFYDEDTQDTYEMVSDTLTVHVTAETDVPVVPVVMDQILTAGDDLVFQVPGLTGYSNWNLRVLRRSDRENQIHNYRSQYEETHAPMVAGETYEIRIPTAYTWMEDDGNGNLHQVTHYILEPGEAYNVELGFFQYNKHGYSFDVPLLVVGNDTIQDAVELTVNGQTGTFHAAAHQDMHIDVQGPANATGLLVFEGNDWRFHEGNQCSYDWGWWTLSHIPEYLFYAKYTTDPIPDTEYDWHDLNFPDTVSNVVRVINDTQGYLPVPEFTLNTDSNGAITRGDWLEADITNLSDYSSYPDVRFYATVYDALTGEGFGGRYFWDGTAPVRIPTCILDPANRTEPFTIDVTSTAGPGWYRTTGYAQFQVEEPAGQNAVFTVSPTEVATGADYTLSLYAPGAAEYRIFKDGESYVWESGMGGVLVKNWSENFSGIRIYEAEVRYENSQEWTPAGSVQVTVTAPNGAMPVLTLDAPVFLEEGEDLVLGWDGIESVDNADLTVWRNRDGERVWHAWGTQKSFTVSAVQPNETSGMELFQQPGSPVLEAGEDYRFRFEFFKSGYEGQVLEGCVYIVGQDEEQVQGALSLKLDGSDAFLQEFEAQIPVTVTVEAPGATGIRVLDPNRLGSRTEPEENDWEYFDRNNFWNSLESTWRFDLGARRILAQARYDDYEDIREADAGDNPWTACSNDILLGVFSNGRETPSPVVQLSSQSVARGEWLTLTVFPENPGEWYWADLSREEESPDSWLGHFDFNDSNQAWINTVALETGTYRLEVFTGAVGFARNGKTTLSFTVTQGSANNPGILVSGNSVEAGRDIFLCAYAPDADRMRLEITCEENPEYYDWREWNGGEEPVHDRLTLNEPGTYCFELKDTGTGNSIGIPVTVTVTEGLGVLTRADLSTLPGSVINGQAFAGSFSVDSRATGLSVDVDYIPDDGSPWQRVYHADRMRGDANWTALNLPGSTLTRNGVYCVHVFTYAPGYQGGDNQTAFIVQPQGSGTPVSLTVNGSNSDLADWPSSSDLHVVAQANGATAIRLLRDGRWWDCQDARNGRAEWHTGFGDGDYTLIAQMTTADPVWRAEDFDWGNFDWNDLEWTGMSNIIKVHVSSQGSLTRPVVTLTPAGPTYTCGDIITVTVAPQPHAQWTWAQLMYARTDGDGNRWFEDVRDGHFDGDSDGTTIRIPTFLFEPGDYYLKVGIDAEGWEGRDAYVPITLEAPSEPLEAMLFLSRETMQANEGLTIHAMAPGASHMELRITWDRDPNWRNDYGSDRDYERWDWGCGAGGVYTFTLQYWMPGSDDPQVLSQTLTVQSHGELEQPVITGVPSVLSLGQGINGSFQAVQDAEWYNVGIRYSADNWDWEDIINEDRQPDDPGLTSLSFGSSVFSRLGSYQLWVNAAATGIDNGYQEIGIEVIDPQTINGNLVLRVDGQTDGTQVGEIFLHQSLPLTITAPEGVTAVRIRSSARYDWEYYAVMSEDDLNLDWGFHQGGSDTLIAQAAVDAAVTDYCNLHGGMWDFDWSQVKWSMTSNTVTVQVTKLGDLVAPQVDFVSLTVQRGAMLEFDLHPVENAYSYGVQVRRADDDWWDWIIDMDYPLDETTRIAVPTDILEPGEYMLHIDPRCFGWNGDTIGYRFTVTPPASPVSGPMFTVSKTELITREPLTFSVSAPGAEEIIVCQENMNEENIWWQVGGETLVDRVTLNWAKTYHILAFARYPGEDEWEQIGQTQNVHVTAPYGTLGLTFDAPESVRPDEALVISLLCDYKGANASAECWAYDAFTGAEHSMEYISDVPEGNLHRVTFRLAANTLSSGTCIISGYVFPNRMGYQLAYEETTVRVAEETVPGTLTVSGNPVEIFEDLTITVHAQGATAVALWGDLFGMGWRYQTGDTLTEVQTMWQDGEYLLYGLYTTEPIDTDAPGFSWENVHWTGATNSLYVTVNPPTAALEPLNYTLSSTTVHRGDEIVVTILNSNAGLTNVSYGASLSPEEPSDQMLPWYGANAQKVIYIPTAEAAPGTYVLNISANAVSCQGLVDQVGITITAPSPRTPNTVLNLPAGLQRIEEEAFEGVMAEKIAVPSGVTVIESRAFADCSNLFALDLPQGLTIAPDALEGCAHAVVLYGPEGSYLQAYADSVDNLYFVPVN